MFTLTQDMENGRSRVMGVFSTRKSAVDGIRKIQAKYGNESELRYQYNWYVLAWSAHHQETVNRRLDDVRHDYLGRRKADVWIWSALQAPRSFDDWAWFEVNRPPARLFRIDPVTLNEIME